MLLLEGRPAISVVKTVDVDPFQGSVRRKELAVVFALHLDLPVVHWGSHGGRSDHGFGLVSVVLEVDVGPDPLRARLGWWHVFANDELLTDLVVSGDCICACVLQTPFESLLVDFLASLGVVIKLGEVGIRMSCMPLNHLP